MNRHNRRPTPAPKSLYKLGEELYFQGFVGPEDRRLLFMCRGIVSRLPSWDYKTYKLIVLSVYPLALVGSGKKDETIATTLLGMKVARLPSQLHKTLDNNLCSSLIDTNVSWISLNETQIATIKRSIG